MLVPKISSITAGVVVPIPTSPAASIRKGEESLAASFTRKLVPEPVFSMSVTTWVAAPAPVTLNGVVVLRAPVSEIRSRLPVLAALLPESVIFWSAPPAKPVEAELIARADPVVRPSAFIVRSPVVVVAALAVRSRSLPVVVMTDVFEIEANVGVIEPLPVTWKRVPEAAPVVELVMAPVLEILTRPVVLFMVAAPVGPSILRAPPVVMVVVPATLICCAYPVVNPVALIV